MRYLTSGRVNQKLRTRNALVEVAARLIRENKPFSIEDVADAAGVGRTTAYRYFPTFDALIAHAVVWKLTETEEQHFKYGADNDLSPDELLRFIIEMSHNSTQEHNGEYRTMLRLSLDDRAHKGKGEALRRPGRRLELIDVALNQVRSQFDEEPYTILRAALCLCIGIEASVVLHDVCRLTPEVARQVKLWASSALLRAALAEAGLPAPKTNWKSKRARTQKPKPAKRAAATPR